MREELIYSYWLSNICGLGAVKAERLLQRNKSAKGVYKASFDQLKIDVGVNLSEKILQSKKNWDVEKEYEKLLKLNVQFYPYWYEKYPERLRKISGKPMGVYVKGILPSNEKKTVAMIGTRGCSQYGIYVARSFAEVLSNSGVQVISGMARGIDSISQQATLDAGGYTLAVLGCGVDVCYPKSSLKLYKELIEKGGILSTYNIGTLPKPELFPLRNRIISGLADAILVIEASLQSGTMITVDMALEQGKDVYVIPGRLTDRCSDGCNRLIQQGAEIVLSPEDLLKFLKIDECRPTQKGIGDEELTFEEKKVYRTLDFDLKTADCIQNEVGDMGLQEVMENLIRLCMKGYGKCVYGSFYVKNRVIIKE